MPPLRFLFAGCRRLGIAALMLTVLTLAPGTAPAQDPMAADVAPPTAAKVEQLVQLLSDPGLADWLRGQVAGQVAGGVAGGVGAAETASPQADPAREGMGPLRTVVVLAKERLAALIAAAQALPDDTTYALTLWQLEMGGANLLHSLGFVALFLAVGCLAESGFRHLTRQVRRRILEAETCDPAVRLGRTVVRLLLDLVAVGVFALFSLGLFFLFEWHAIVQLLVFSMLVAGLMLRLTHVLSTFLLAPRFPALRLIRIDDRTAQMLHGWIMVLTGAAAFALLFLAALDDLGFFQRSAPLLSAAAGLILVGLAGTLAWRTRRELAGLLQSNGEAEPNAGSARLRGHVAELGPLIATLYLLLAWLSAVLGTGALALTLLILAAIPFADAVLQAIVQSACAATQGPACRHDGDETAPTEDHGAGAAANPFPVARRAVRAVIVLAGMVAVVHAWGFDLAALAQTDGTAAAILKAIFNVVVTVLLADLVWTAAKTAIDRKLTALGAGPGAGLPAESGEGGGAAGPGARERTLLPLIRNFIMVVLAVMTTLIVLSSIGVDIGPLLAGAGVVGLAIGFGAQTLVRDIVAGVFFLLEDAFRVGEYVEIGELRGTVEAISLRSMKLRHHRGQVHTLPFGEIPSLTNYSRDWIIMKLEFRVPFDTDLTKFKKLVKGVGQELANHPEYSQHILEPVKSQGVRRMEEFNMVVGVKFMTKPGEQWVLRRETYQRILAAMEAAGIRLATRNVQVEVTGPGSTDPERIRSAAAAAAEPLLAPVGPPAPIPDTP